MITLTNSLKEAKDCFLNWLEEKFGNELLIGKKIFLKPNMGYPKKSPYTTSLKIIKIVVDTLNKFKAQEIIIGEGSTSAYTAKEIFKEIGLYKALKGYKVTFVDLNELESIEVKLGNNSIHYLPAFLKEIDLRISIPVIKFYDDEQGETFLSNTIKNFFGLPPKIKYKKSSDSYKRDDLHHDLHKSVAEIFQAVEQYSPFDFYICDGLKILYGEAEKGEPFKWGKIILADNAIEADLKVLELLKKPLPRYLKLIMEKEKK
ncbi:MAG: DUF362 domain-containing protein [Asgard group archaeon]|nr:DUF362 domain-containing protein [Asgard group archaeon]